MVNTYTMYVLRLPISINLKAIVFQNFSDIKNNKISKKSHQNIKFGGIDIGNVPLSIPASFVAPEPMRSINKFE